METLYCWNEMRQMPSKSEEEIMSVACMDSPSLEEETSSGGNGIGSGPLKKGPWTSAEDEILMDYVNKHGEGNWNAVQKYSGLLRCGKSCRLRWANHLRPDLKKGAFTLEEERLIVELHAKLGNKWARMATHLPGRTDNEIKNFWNTRFKRRQRAGLPIYPPEVSLQALHENQQQSSNVFNFATEGVLHSEISQTDDLGIPAVEFKKFELNQELHPSVLDIPGNSIFPQNFGSSVSNSFLFPVPPASKRIHISEPYFPDCSVARSFDLPTSHHHFHALNASLPQSSSSVLGSHALRNGNPSSAPISWVTKQELPSLQYYTDPQGGGWGTLSSPLPSLESVDTLIQSPPATERTESDCQSPRNSGLLEAVLYESLSKNSSRRQIFNAESSSQKLHESELEMYGNPVSPWGHSAASVFSYTPISGSSLDEPQSVETIPDGCEVNHKPVECSSDHSDRKDEASNYTPPTRPDALLGLDWFGSSMEHGKDRAVLSDALGALFGDGLCSERNETNTSSASPVQGKGSWK